MTVKERQQNSFNTYSQPYHLAQNTNPNTTSDVGNYANNQLPQPKPIYTNPNPRRYSTGEILWEGVKGFGEGIVSGLETLANGITFGGYD